MSKRTTVLLAVALTCAFLLTAGCGSQQAGLGEIFVSTNSDQARSVFERGLDTFEKFRTVEARELFGKAIEIDPDFAMAHMYRAWCSSTSQEFNEHMQKAAELETSVTPGERQMIRATYASGVENNPGKAIRILQQLSRDFPRDKRVRVAKASIHHQQGSYDKAIVELRLATTIDPDYSAAYNLLGYAHTQKREFGMAEQAFKNYIRVLPDEANPHDSIADLYTRMGRHNDAIRHYQKAAEMNPNFAFSVRKVGTSLIYQGKFDQARNAFRKSMQQEPDASGKLAAQAGIADSYVYEGRLDDAIGAAEELVQMAEDANIPEWQARAHSARCDIYTAKGELDLAEASIQDCRQVVTSSNLLPAIKDKFVRGALFDQALIACKRGDMERAWQKSDAYLAKIEAGHNPKLMENHHALLGHLYLAEGDFEKSISNFLQANQEDPYTVFHLARAQAASGNNDDATELYQKVAEWNQNSLNYALVRGQAMGEVQKQIAGK